MGLTKLKFSIKHSAGVNVIRFRINYKEYDKQEIYSYQTSPLPNLEVDGEMELNIVRSYVDIEIEAVGTANRSINYNVEYKGKKLLKDNESKINVENSGRVVAIKNSISLNPNS